MTGYEYIYDLGGGKFARGNAGGRATWVVRRVLTGGRPKYIGVQARKPRIPTDASRIARDRAGASLLSALGLDN